MKCLLAILGVMSLHTGMAQWVPIDAPRVTRYEDVFFLNDTLGWLADGTNRRIYRTVNQGITWDRVHQSDKYVRSIEFANDSVGIAGTLNRGLLRSTDGGITWTDVYDQITPSIPLEGEGICGLSLPTDSTFYGCGEWTAPAYVIKSTDAGNNWTYSDLSAFALTLVDILFVDENRGFVTGRSIIESEGGIVLSTTDGGDSWQKVFTTDSAGDYVWKIQTPDSIHFYGSVQARQVHDNVRIIRSDDGGISWETALVDNQYNYMQMVGFLTPELGWTAGEGKIFETRDGGDSWEEIVLDGFNYNRFFRLNDSTAFLSANRIFTYDPEAGAPVLGVQAKDLEWVSFYPNPTTDQLKVSVTPANATYLQLTLINAAGTLEQVIWDGPITKPLEWTLESSTWSDGIYFLNLQTHDHHETYKVRKGVNP